MAGREPDGSGRDGASPARVLVLGDAGDLREALVRRLSQDGGEARASAPRDDADAKAMLVDGDWSTVVILAHDDALALRLTLLCAEVRPDVALWTTLFDRSVGHELRRLVPAVGILSPADVAAAELLARCTAAGACAVPGWRRGVRLVDDALRLLTIAGAGLLLVAVMQVVLSLVALHERLVDAIFFSVRTLATIADAPAADSAAGWYKLVATALAGAAVLLLAVFTAALVRRLNRRRLTTLVGPRAAPAHGHVVLVGLGQVGLRLAQELIARSIPMIAVERDAEAPGVRLARRLRVPVAIADGEDRATLQLVGLRRAVVLAAVTSDDLVNVSVGLTAADVAPGVPIVLRFGDGQVAAETDSLLHLGDICDLHAVVADRIAERVTAPARS